jgi:hypothetical protein
MHYTLFVVLFSNDVCTSLFAHPDLVYFVRIHVPPSANAQCLLGGLWVIRI